MKQTIRLLVFCALAVLATNKTFAYDFTEGDWGFNITSAGEVECFCTNPEIEIADIPSTVGFANKQFTVTKIGASCFAGTEYVSGKIKTVHIPASVTTIGKKAFYFCEFLKEINLPTSVTTIGDEAFKGCKGVTRITIPNSVTSLGKFVFSSSGLTYISLPSSIQKMGIGTFESCRSLTKIDFPTTTYYNRIFGRTFWGCSALQSINIPDNIIAIDYYAFRSCDSLTTINLPESVTEINLEAFASCDNLSSVIMPGVKVIYESAFEDCDNLSSVIMPGVKVIYKSAFRDCKNLEDVYTANLEKIDEAAFLRCKKLKTFTFPPSVTAIYYGAFIECDNLTDLYCYPSTPPEYDIASIGYDNIFNDLTYKLCNLHVLQDSFDLYKNRYNPSDHRLNYWSQFLYIYDDLTEWTGVTNVTEDTKTDPVAIFSTNGQLVYSGYEAEIPILPHGIYIKRDNRGNTSKFMVK